MKMSHRGRQRGAEILNGSPSNTGMWKKNINNHRKRKRFRKTERQRGSGPRMGKKWQENSPRIRKLPRWGRGRGAACARAAANTGKGEVSTAAGEGSRERRNQREMERKTRVKIRATQKQKELQTQILTTGRKFKDGERNTEAKTEKAERKVKHLR